MGDITHFDQKDLTHIVRTLICVSHLHHSAIEGRVSKLGFHHSQHRMLMHLAKHEHIPSQKELADELGISPAAVTTTLKRLEKDGYITRTATEGDNRCNEIRITEAGRSVIQESCEIFYAVDKAMFEGFDDHELSTLTSLLSRMKENLKADSIDF